MTPQQAEVADRIRLLARTGALQTEASIHYGESTSRHGWQHLNVMVHQREQIVLTLYVGISPSGDDTPARGDDKATTLAGMLDQLVGWVVENRVKEVAA